MAETMTVTTGNTLTGMLKSKRAVQENQMHLWLRKLRPINPHISNLNRIYPGEKVLIPDTLAEIIGDGRIWQNAFAGIPSKLASSHNERAQLFLAMPGNTIDSIAKGMFENSPHSGMSLSAKRAVLIHNNPDLTQFIDTGIVPCNMLLDITPQRLNRFDRIYWQRERPAYMSYLEQMTPLTKEMFQETGPENSYLMARLVQTLNDAGAAVGVDGAIGGFASGGAAAAELALSQINGLARQIYDDAARQFGRKAAASLTKTNLAKMAQFIKAHPSYPLLMRQLKKVPRILLPMSRAGMMPPAAAGINSQALPRYFSKQYFQAFRRWPSGKYMGSIARQLNGRVNFFRALGRHATWYVPAVIGLYNVYDAPPELRVRTLFEEGFGVLGGWGGTELGYGLGLGIVLILGLGPMGMFITVLICATAGGIGGNLAGKTLGTEIYEYGQTIYSPEQLIEGF